MLEYEEAVQKAIELGQDLGARAVESVRVEDAFERVLAEDVRAVWPFPARDYSAMDGYAVRTADFVGCTYPVRLPLRGESRPGAEQTSLLSGEVRRIFTGGTVPTFADAVVMQENVTALEGTIEFSAPPRPFDHIRQAGEDLESGALGLGSGTRISAAGQSLLGMLERREVRVRSRPRVAILCTGDELRDPVGVSALAEAGSLPLPAGLAESNSLALRSMALRRGATVTVLPRVRDDRALLRAAVSDGLGASDVLVTVGGASVGDHDLVRPLLHEMGAEIVVPKVAIKPGKPVFLAKIGAKAVLGLPGNPSSALVTFCLFGWPLLGAWLSDREPCLPEVTAPFAGSYRQKAGRRAFLRGQWTRDGVRILPNQASGAGTAIALANVLVHLKPDVETLEHGDQVSVIPLWGL